MNNIEKKILPSNGILDYIPKEVVIRGMKGREISTLFSSLSDAAIDDIIKNVVEPALDPNELCDEDKLFILHQTRVLTFGTEVQQTLRCPFCGHIHNYVLDYSDFEIIYLEEDYLKEELTINNASIKRRIPNSKILDEVKVYKEKIKLPDSYAFILLQATKIASINGKRKSIGELVEYLENLPGKELVKISKFLEKNFGLQTSFKVECVQCKTAFTGGIGINADLFREPDRDL
jgi:hypothetical protein